MLSSFFSFLSAKRHPETFPGSFVQLPKTCIQRGTIILPRKHPEPRLICFNENLKPNFTDDDLLRRYIDIYPEIKAIKGVQGVGQANGVIEITTHEDVPPEDILPHLKRYPLPFTISTTAPIYGLASLGAPVSEPSTIGLLFSFAESDFAVTSVHEQEVEIGSDYLSYNDGFIGKVYRQQHTQEADALEVKLNGNIPGHFFTIILPDKTSVDMRTLNYLPHSPCNQLTSTRRITEKTRGEQTVQ